MAENANRGRPPTDKERETAERELGQRWSWGNPFTGEPPGAVNRGGSSNSERPGIIPQTSRKISKKIANANRRR